MFKLKRVIILVVLVIPFLAKAQSSPQILDFVKFVGTKYRIPESLKYDCGWNYAVVKLTTNKQNEVTDYQCLNEASDTMKNSLRFFGWLSIPKEDAHKRPPDSFLYHAGGVRLLQTKANGPHLPANAGGADDGCHAIQDQAR